LAQLRTVDSATRDAAKVRQQLTHSASTYFFDARQPQVVAVDRVGRQGTTSSRFVAAATPAALLDAISAAFKQNDIEYWVVLPAQEAWQRSITQDRARASCTMDHAGIRYAFADSAHLTGIRRRPIAESDSAIAEARAAEFATATPRLPFLRELEHQRAADQVRRFIRLSLGAAAAGVLLTAALRLVDVRRELGAVQQARATLAPQLQVALRERNVLFALERDISAIRGREGTAASWTRAFETIARALPPSATLMALRGQADTLIIEGTAPNAGAVFEAVQRAAGVASVRSVAPVRQAFDSSRGPFELFSLALTLSAKTETTQ
jgi:Tfp pilus assembly protein PilN